MLELVGKGKPELVGKGTPELVGKGTPELVKLVALRSSSGTFEKKWRVPVISLLIL